MRLVRLSCDCYVNPDDVTTITVNRSSDTLTVRMRDGIGHSVDRDYNKGIYATLDRLRAELEAAAQPEGVGRVESQGAKGQHRWRPEQLLNRKNFGRRR